MLARCTANSGLDLGVPERGNFYGVGTVFHLTIGTQYRVLGMGLFETVMLALVCDDTGKPNWLPVGLFEFGIASFPSDWEFTVLDGHAASGGDPSNRWVARWGYPELVRDERHSDRLTERDPGALDIFFRALKASG
jgi:hypothetical protein